MEKLIVLIRLPIGLAYFAVAFAIYAVVAVISGALLPFGFIFAAVFWHRELIQDSWIGRWPYFHRFCDRFILPMRLWVSDSDRGIGEPGVD